MSGPWSWFGNRELTSAVSYSVVLSRFVDHCCRQRADLAFAVDIVLISDRGACAKTKLLLINNHYCYRLSSAEETSLPVTFIIIVRWTCSCRHITTLSLYNNIYTYKFIIISLPLNASKKPVAQQRILYYYGQHWLIIANHSHVIF